MSALIFGCNNKNTRRPGIISGLTYVIAAALNTPSWPGYLLTKLDKIHGYLQFAPFKRG
jgi:hypothetical protein